MRSVKDLESTTDAAAADGRADWTVEDAEELYRVKAGVIRFISSRRTVTSRSDRCSNSPCRSTFMLWSKICGSVMFLSQL